jgi:hypothetical protein
MLNKIEYLKLMQSFFQRGHDDQRRPLWLRLIAIVCLFVVCVMSTAQVSHTHAEFSFLKQNSRNSPAPDDHCPLCVAMHSAMPMALHTAPEPMLQIQALDSVAADAERIFRWRFEMASRPPPADQNRA